MLTSRREIVIDARHQGIPSLALGGYVGGLLAGELQGGEVTIRRPVPLGKRLWMERADDAATTLLDGDQPLASLDPAVRVGLVIPGAVTLDEARDASTRSLQRSSEYWHPFPECMVC